MTHSRGESNAYKSLERTKVYTDVEHKHSNVYTKMNVTHLIGESNVKKDSSLFHTSMRLILKMSRTYKRLEPILYRWVAHLYVKRTKDEDLFQTF